MIQKAGIALALLLLAASPCAAFSITPADGWLWKIDVALDNIRASLTPSLAPRIAAERHQEAIQMIEAGDAVAAQQAMNHVRSPIKDSITFSELEDLEVVETSLWQGYEAQYGIGEIAIEFPIPLHLQRIPDGEYEFTITTTSGKPLGTYTALKLAETAYVRSGVPSGEYGKAKFHWTYTVSEVESLAGRHGYISQPRTCQTCGVT